MESRRTDEEELSEQKKSYYTKNREMILQRNKEYYHKKKNDPDFYKKVLDRNKKCYNKKQLPALTQEDKDRDEKQMYELMNWINTLRDMDKDKQKEENVKTRKEMTAFFNQFYAL